MGRLEKACFPIELARVHPRSLHAGMQTVARQLDAGIRWRVPSIACPT